MKYRPLGRTGMLVSELCLGNMMFGAIGNRDHDDCVRIIHRALDHGINFIDTADVYSAGESEEITAKALAGGRRDSVILATKCHFPVDLGPFAPNRKPNTWGNSRRHILKACDDSLRRLGTDWIDVYQLHRPDPNVAPDETVSAMSDLVHQGKIRAWGTSTFPPSMVMQMHAIADRLGLVPPSTEQPPYSIFVRYIERELLPVCRQLSIGTLVWSPMNGGWLSGRYRKDAVDLSYGRPARMKERFDPALEHNARKLDLIEELVPIADGLATTLAKLANAWVLRHPGVTSAIIGPRTMEQLDGVLGCEDLDIPTTVLDRIDELVPAGHNVQPDESLWLGPWITDPAERRR